MPGPFFRLTSVTLMSPAPRELAHFYAKMLSGEVVATDPPKAGEPDSAGWAQVRTATITLNFEWEAHWSRPRWPAEDGQPNATQHLDVQVNELDAAVDFALGCGARLAEVQPQDDVRVLFDPSGHPFCLYL